MSSSESETEGSDSNEKRGKAGSSRKRKSLKDDKMYAPSSSGSKVTEKRQKSSRVVRTSTENDGAEASHSKSRSCTKAECKEPQPQCCLGASSSCTGGGYTSRWYHMSLGEHYCNDCFDYFYRVNKPGYSEYDNWSQLWEHVSYCKPNLNMFLAECILPYWIQCTLPNCRKWREFRMEGEPTAEFIHNFTCKTAYKRICKKHCDIVEAPSIASVAKRNWLRNLTEVPFLKKSPSGPYLTMYITEFMGLSPPTCNTLMLCPPKHISPFYQFLNGQSQIWINPDIIDKYEEDYMPTSVMSPSTFMGIRNLIVCLWNLLPYNWLTLNKIGEYLICRGLVRIYLLGAAEKIMKIFTQMAVINYGLVHSPVDYSPLSPIPEKTVIIVGAGISGLSTARHLKNHGVKTVVVETKSRIGGRIWDINNLSHGADVVYGLTCNPLTILCHQAKSSINEVSDVVLISINGVVISDEIYEKMMHHYSDIMNDILEWTIKSKEDASWYDVITKKQEFNEQAHSFTSEENDVFNCILNLKEIEQGVPHKRLTLVNYECRKIDGGNGSVSGGLHSLIKSMAEDLDVRLDTKVTSISFENEHVSVATNQGTLTASKVVISVPLTILKANKIKFNPPLPEEKTNCISELGYHCYEKIFLQFPNRFWAPLLTGDKKRFAIVANETLLFRLFEDVTTADDKLPTLVSFFFTSSFDSVEKNEELKEICTEILRRLFSTMSIEVPEPSYYYVTQWSLDPDIMCSGSFVEVGSTYSLYDAMAKDIDEKLFFAGEATYRRCPNSVTGAFLSGLREASKILNYISPITPLSPGNIVS